MQLANVFAGRWDERKKWGFHIMDSWQMFFDTGREIGQISGDFKTEDVVKNDSSMPPTASMRPRSRPMPTASPVRRLQGGQCRGDQSASEMTGGGASGAAAMFSAEERPMFVFDHVGITTTVKQPDENWVEQSRVWVTNPRDHPEHIEFLRYEPGTTVPAAVRNNPHIAFRVDDLGPHIEGQEILIPPFVVGDFLEVVFIRKYDTVFEYMHYLKEGWFGN